uniref:Uncharacterized protein n=1 Tax=viral metagenome TaxID=1070528 RepID=A0A6C0B3D6_9ZZZZ
MTYRFVSFPPIRNDINNTVLTAPRAMPFKDANASGDSVFSFGRSTYMRSLDLSLTNSKTPAKTKQVIWKKQFYGGTNRDASSIASKRRTTTIGLSSTNELGGKITFS